MDTVLITGLIGMGCILAAFIMNVFHRIESHDWRFLWLNFIGSVMLLLYAYFLNSAPFLILNTVWAVVALWGILHLEARK